MFYSRQDFGSKFSQRGWSATNEDYLKYLEERQLYLYRHTPQYRLPRQHTFIPPTQPSRPINPKIPVVPQTIPEKKPQSMKTVTAKEIADKERDKERKDGYISSAFNITGQYKTKANAFELPAEDTKRARALQASRIHESNNQGDNFDMAQQYLDQYDTGYKINQELSDSEGLVYETPEGNVEMAFRGTNPKNLEDLKTDARIAFGYEENSPQFQRAEAQIQGVEDFYGKLPDHYSGYSLGGSKSMTFGQKYNTPSTSFNPFVGKNLYKTPANQTTPAEQNIWRTQNDPVSFGLAFKPGIGAKTSWKVNVMPEMRDVKGGWDIYNSHKLNNFFQTRQQAQDNLEQGQEEGNDYDDLSRQYRNQTFKTFQYNHLDLADKAIKNGSTFTEHIHNDLQGNTGQDTVADEFGRVRLAGGRHNSGSVAVRNWLAAGGDFTKEELEFLNENDKKLFDDDDLETWDDEDNPNERLQKEGIVREAIKSQKELTETRNVELRKLRSQLEQRVTQSQQQAGEINEGLERAGLTDEFRARGIEPTASIKHIDHLLSQQPDTNRLSKLILGEWKNRTQGLNMGDTYQYSSGRSKLTDDEQVNMKQRIMDNWEDDIEDENYRGLTPDETDDFVNTNDEGRSKLIKDGAERLDELQNNLEDYVNPADQIDQIQNTGEYTPNTSGFKSQLKGAFSPTTLATGFLGGIASNELMNVIDPDHKIPTIPRTGLVGAGAGISSYTLASGLSGVATTSAGFTTAGLSGGIGAVTAIGADKAIEASLKAFGASDELSKGIGMPVGYGVGGAAASLTSTLGTMAAEGATFGEAGGPEGAAVGFLAGTAIGLGSYLGSKLGSGNDEDAQVEYLTKDGFDYDLGK